MTKKPKECDLCGSNNFEKMVGSYNISSRKPLKDIVGKEVRLPKLFHSIDNSNVDWKTYMMVYCSNCELVQRKLRLKSQSSCPQCNSENNVKVKEYNIRENKVEFKIECMNCNKKSNINLKEYRSSAKRINDFISNLLHN